MGKSPADIRNNPKKESPYKTTLYITAYTKPNGATGLKKSFMTVNKNESQKLS